MALVVYHMTKDPIVEALGPTSLVDHGFLLMVIANPMEPRMFIVFPNTFHGKMPQHWYSSQFTNSSDVQFAHPLSFY
jgi:hypothetical protein